MLYAALVALFVLLAWLTHGPSKSSPPEASRGAEATSTRAEPRAEEDSRLSALTTREQPSILPGMPIEERAREGLAALNDEIVVLHGKVVDQFDSPVGDAVVRGNIQVNNGTRVGVDRILLSTDANGLFAISGYNGKSLGVQVEKPGYVMAATNTRFVYSLLWSEGERHQDDPEDPVLIRMWRLQGAQPLTDISKDYRLPCPIAPLYFDLIDGKVLDEGGDLKLVITRAMGEFSKRKPGDWSAELVPVDGGIMESDHRIAQVTFEAPQSGYQSNLLFAMKHEGPAWFDGINKTFFMKSRNGQVCSKFYMEFGINREPESSIWVRFRGVANTNRSRNWEASAPQ